MKILELPDDSGFMGLANFAKYRSFISSDWDFEMIKRRIIEEMNAHHLLFWATGFGNLWKVKIDAKPSTTNAYREAEGIIEVTDKKLYLTNYESLTMAAQFDDLKLPEKHLEDLVIELDNGSYLVQFKQLFNPDEEDYNSNEINFEIALTEIEKS
ncbi:MAG: hypothetical protein AAGA31_15155, partial [Bacteroidota bacterium]